jgi:adenylate kinase
MGPAGSGKSTQSKLLLDYFERTSPGHPRFYLYTGEQFRTFIQGEKYSHKRAKAIQDEGGRQPDFLAILMWGEAFVEGLTGGEHIVADGSPRSMVEAQALDTAVTFYERAQPFVFELTLPTEKSVERLLPRARHDDTEDKIVRRVSWFNTDVLPVVEYYRNNPRYTFATIDGDQSVEEIHKDIIDIIEKRSG